MQNELPAYPRFIFKEILMKFIHIADVHWGMNPDSDRPWSKERAQAIRDSFA